jgi:hypothetical protein
MLNLKITALSRTKYNITLFGEGCQTIVLSCKNIVCYMLKWPIGCLSRR